jgi:hypothetical protein
MTGYCSSQFSQTHTLSHSTAAHKQADKEKYDEENEQGPCDLSGSASDAGEPENRRDKTYNEKSYRPAQHDRVLLSAQ